MAITVAPAEPVSGVADFNTYQELTDRHFPVAVLERTSA